MDENKFAGGWRVSVRLTPEQGEKLAMLAAQTERTASGVIRLLVDQAEVGERPDVRLAGKTDDAE